MRIWHAAADRVVPVRHSRGLARRVGAELLALDGGHREALVRGGPQALEWLAGLGDPPAER